MRVAYLVNHYPSVSHSFIRREIHALESLGVEVLRFSIRPPGICPDASDQSEAEKTHVLLARPLGLLLDFLVLLVSNPVGVSLAAWHACLLSVKADRGRVAHIGYLLEACRLCRALKTSGTKHIHAHFGTNPPAVALLCSKLSDVTFSFTVHGPEEFDRPIALKLQRKMDAASFVVAISSYGRSQLMRWCPRSDWRKISVVRCGVDDSYLTHSAAQIDGSNVLVCVGRLCEQKGQLLLLDAMRALLDSGVSARLVLAGDGDMRPVIEERIAELKLSEHVQITGWLSGAQVKEVLLSCRAMVLPSFAEGLPVVIMEALALQRPVITTYVAGIPELVENLHNGWLVPAGSSDLLSQAMTEALAISTEDAAVMGAAGRAAVSQKHSATDETKRLKTLFATHISL